MYEFLDAAIVRAPALSPESPGIPWPDLAGPDATSANWRTWLKSAWQVPAFALAVEAASPDLARHVGKILDREDVQDTAIRRAVIATLRYLLRVQTRATPFGLLAGIAPVRIGEATATRPGDRHRWTVRTGAAWIDDVTSRLKADPALLLQLCAVANTLVVRRSQHLVIEHRASNTATGVPERVKIRATAPVLAALDLAEQPLGTMDLAAKLAAGFPAVPGHVIDGLILKLVRQRFLLTNLRPAANDPDPLAAVLRVLDALSLPGDSEAAHERHRLHEIHTALLEHDAALDPAVARTIRSRAADLTADSPPLAIDLRIDWDLTIPKPVAAEAARAAGIMARLAKRPALSAGWTDWHARFLDRYGPSAVVPLLDVVDGDTGLGYPAGYLDTPYAMPTSQLTDRDKSLLKLAHTAAVHRATEVVLDDATVTELSVLSAEAPVQPSAEITVRVHAENARDVDEGRFELHVTGASRGAGTIAGRFLHVLDDGDRGRMMDLYASTPGVHLGGMTVQLIAAPIHSKTGNVIRAPRMSAPAIFLGEYHEPGSDQVPLADLAVTADATRLHLVSISRRQPVHVILLNAVDLAYHAHPLARFLVESSNALAAPCIGFEWGAAHVLPFLPAVRYGRTILCPARWLLSATDLPGEPATTREWDTAFAKWRQQVCLPDWVSLGGGDQCIRLHLSEPSHRVLVRDDLRRTGQVMLRSAPTPDDLGWTAGRVHEVVIPVRATRQVGPVRWPGQVTGRHHGFLPMQDGRLYLKLLSTHDQQDAVLTRHMPDLQRRLGEQLKSCWFIRYDQPSAHLRLRLMLGADASSSTIQQVSAWSEALRDEGLVSGVSWETYYPEIARFGGPAALEAAEAFFAADSATTIAQLSVCAVKDGPDPRAVTAASLIDLAVSLLGDDASAMDWLVEHTVTDSTPPPRALYKQAVALVGTGIITTDIDRSWEQRRAAATVYSDALRQAGTIRPEELLPDLLHLHHVRMAGPDLAAERTCLHLARAAALSRIARTRKK